MPDGMLLGPLVLFAAAVTLTPGPNVVMITASAANFGFRRTIPQILGITLAFALMTLAGGLGVAGLVGAEPLLHSLIKYAGAAYLTYLAWRIGRADAHGVAPTSARPIGFLEAVLLTWMNPKAWASALGALAAYTTDGGKPMGETSLVALILASSCLLSAVLWATFGSGIGRYLANPRTRAAFNWSMAGLLLLSLVPVLW